MTTITLLLKECLEKLTALLESGQLVHFHTEVAMQRWEDELGRLRVWAANIGIHQTGETSLDYRLRDASHIKNETVRLLQRFQGLLNDLDDLAEGGERVSTDDDNGNETIAEFQQKLRESDDYNSTEAQDIYQNMVELINHLYQMSIAIRQPAKHDQLVARSIDRSYFEYRAQQHVYDKYPHADSYLVARIGAAMAKQKAILKDRERHHMKPTQERYGHNRPDSEALFSKRSETVAAGPFLMHWPLEFLKGFSNTSASKAPMVTEDSLSVPPPPESSNDRKPFQCPYCFVIITIKNRNDWAHHVFHDLMPYVCIFSDCSSPSRLYESRSEWTDHLYWEHSLSSNSAAQFTCPICKCDIQQVWSSFHVGYHLRDLALFVLQHDEDTLRHEYRFNPRALIPPHPRNAAASSFVGSGTGVTDNESNGISLLEQHTVKEAAAIKKPLLLKEKEEGATKKASEIQETTANSLLPKKEDSIRLRDPGGRILTFNFDICRTWEVRGRISNKTID